MPGSTAALTPLKVFIKLSTVRRLSMPLSPTVFDVVPGDFVYGARHLVTATLDSGQISGGIFFFLQYPSGAPQAIFFDLNDVFTRFLHNFEVQISGNYYMLHFH